ncbi:BRCA1-associated protein 2-domain-containing protein [Gamsiella multidivaricata]|uniref:BRCA1-associated protein 2-domain-containing protein n=1 Tax=Gamsiella multidivaricata TaxID=101098 RepID=UPI00221F9AE0|nr:BRCA1-associated protein 2-domain-containing protein [Gamsiella multidivaricata]KAI7830443.1 BRCA1-associated protein 2-domain-containing protein [Gamsiella multidivaricata]
MTSTSTSVSAAAAGAAGFRESESTQGILRLYKDTNEITTGDIRIQSSTEKQEGGEISTTNDRAVDAREGAQIIHPDHGTTVCVLAVPSYMSPGDFLNFVGPVRSNVSHFRIIRDAVPNRFMVLMKFRTSEVTAEFYRRYNGKAFSSLEPEICHVVYLKSIEIRAGCMPPYAFPFLNDDPFLQNNSAATSASVQPTSGMTSTITETSSVVDSLTHQLSTDHAGLAELPTCPVCLERMDSSVTGLLTILCQHTFHCHCLSKWGEGSCPVCRYSQKSIKMSNHSGNTAFTDGITEDRNVCALCGTSENLWICLICGHIGCGRYQEKHAYHHYYETSHLYALELETQRVWDYAGDGYVHRLIQNKADGKLVELPSAVDGTLPSQHSVQVGQEKLDAIGLEYTYLLTSQLESQRLYFDAQVAAMAAQIAQLNKEAKEWEKEASMLNQKNRELALLAEALEKEKVPMLIKEKKATEKRLEKMQERLQMLERQYEEEKEMNVGLRTNQDNFKERLQEKEAEIQELQEQVRDMMIYLDTQQKVEASSMKDELVNGTIGVVPSSSLSPSTNHSRRKGGRR